VPIGGGPGLPAGPRGAGQRVLARRATPRRALLRDTRRPPAIADQARGVAVRPAGE